MIKINTMGKNKVNALIHLQMEFCECQADQKYPALAQFTLRVLEYKYILTEVVTFWFNNPALHFEQLYLLKIQAM